MDCADEVHQGAVQLVGNYRCLGGEVVGDGLEVLVLVLGTRIVEVEESLHDPGCWIKLKIEERRDSAHEVIYYMTVEGEEGPVE